eukprot:COSAG01_NODE_1004_length_12197_cov_8.942718_3_plen_223_part_00
MLSAATTPLPTCSGMVLRMAAEYAEILGRDSDKIQSWLAVADALADFPTVVDPLSGREVFAEATDAQRNTSLAFGANLEEPMLYLTAVCQSCSPLVHALAAGIADILWCGIDTLVAPPWLCADPAEQIGRRRHGPPPTAEEARLWQVANDTLFGIAEYTARWAGHGAWAPLNGLCQLWPPVARLIERDSSAAVLDIFSQTLVSGHFHQYYYTGSFPCMYLYS